MPLAFESPFLGKKNSHSSSSNNQLAANGCGSPHKPTHSIENYQQSDNQPAKRRKKRKEKFCAVDKVIGLSRHKIKEEASNIMVHTRMVNLRTAEVSTDSRVHLYMYYEIFCGPNRSKKHSNLRSYSFNCTLNPVGNVKLLYD